LTIEKCNISGKCPFLNYTEAASNEFILKLFNTQSSGDWRLVFAD